MIRPMRSKVLIGVLILGWVTLSGLDLLEDLNNFSGLPQLAKSSSPEHVGAKRNGWGTLANNIVESATGVSDSGVSFAAHSLFVADFGHVIEFRGFFLRHKLYRVFLI